MDIVLYHLHRNQNYSADMFEILPQKYPIEYTGNKQTWIVVSRDQKVDSYVLCY